MAKKRNKKRGNARNKHRRMHSVEGFSVRRMTSGERRRFMERQVAGTVTLDEKALAFMDRIREQIQAFELATFARREPSSTALILGAMVCGQLRDRHGPDARWEDLDAVELLKGFAWLPAKAHASMHAFLSGLIAWLAEHGQLDPGVAARQLDALRGDGSARRAM